MLAKLTVGDVGAPHRPVARVVARASEHVTIVGHLRFVRASERDSSTRRSRAPPIPAAEGFRPGWLVVDVPAPSSSSHALWFLLLAFGRWLRYGGRSCWSGWPVGWQRRPVAYAGTPCRLRARLRLALNAPLV